MLIAPHFSNDFYKTKSPSFPKLIAAQGSIEMRLIKKTWRAMNCTPTIESDWEIQENILCIGKRK